MRFLQMSNRKLWISRPVCYLVINIAFVKNGMSLCLKEYSRSIVIYSRSIQPFNAIANNHRHCHAMNIVVKQKLSTLGSKLPLYICGI